MATTTKPVSTAPENPLAEGLARVTGIDPLSSSAGTADLIAYDPNLAFRAPEGDVIQISGDPGSGATTAETWSHELALEQLRNQQLEFEYAQQQDLIRQAQQAKEFGLSQTASQLAARQAAAQQSQFASTYALQQAEAQRAAAMAPYELEKAQLANQTAAYALPAQQLAAKSAEQQMAQNAAIRKAQTDYWNTAVKTPGFSYSYGGLSPLYTVNQQGVSVAASPNYQTGHYGQPVDPYALTAHHK